MSEPALDIIPFPGSAERSAPYSAEAELAVLGGMMLDADALAKALVVVDANHFYREGNRRIFRAMVRIFERGEVIDFVTLPEELRKLGELESAGGLAFLSGLMDAVPTAANIEYHAGIVRDHATRRRVIEVGQEVARAGYEATKTGAEAVADAEALVMTLGATAKRGGFVPMRSRLWPLFDRFQQIAESGREVSGLSSGFDDLDRLTSGFQPGDLIIVAARPSMGKTSFVNQILLNAALAGHPVGLFSVESSTDSIVTRMLCSEARVDSTALRRGRLLDDDYARLATAAGYLNTAPIHIDETPGLTNGEFRAKARRLKSDVPNLAMIGVDYLQLMAGSGKPENRQQEVSEISRTLKAVAKELGIPVVALSQLSRAVEQRPDKRPQLSDLRESGSLEQDADVVAFLYRPEYYFGPVDKQGNTLIGRAELIVAKNREGATGKVDLHFAKEFTRFDGVTRKTSAGLGMFGYDE